MKKNKELTINEIEYKRWLNNKSLDAKNHNALTKIKHNKINAYFGEELMFGTAGIRGLMGPGNKRLNSYTIRKAAWSLGQFLKKQNANNLTKGIVIAHDNRHMSNEFSEISAKVLIDLGFKVFLFENNELQPTPLLSYVIRKMNLASGIVITASHNPKEYNGFKVYDHNGCQLLPKDTDEISLISKKIDFFDIALSDQEKWSTIPQKIIDNYITDLNKIQFNNQLSQKVSIVFSPQQGTSLKIMERLFEENNYQYFTVPEQRDPNPDFNGTKSPNPENNTAYDKIIKFLKKKNFDIGITTDPDADRVGVVLKVDKQYKILNGNQTAAILLEYILSNTAKVDLKNKYIAKSIVSTTLVDAIAKEYNVKVKDTLTGFKWIGNLIENTKNEDFLYGFEESYGSLINSDLCRDKDGFQTALLIADAASYYKSQNKTLNDVLLEIYDKYGYYYEQTTSIMINNKAEVEDFMHTLRQDISSIGGIKVLKTEDFRKGVSGFPKTNMIKFHLEDGSWIAVRPSGTEPKLKIYYCTIANNKINAIIKFRKFEKEIKILTNVSKKTQISKKEIGIWLFWSVMLMAVLLILVYRFYSNDSRKSWDIFTAIWHHSSRDLSSQNAVYFVVFLFTIFLTWAPFSALGVWIVGKKFKTGLKYRHAFIAQILDKIVSGITPFSTGGQILQIWYLRRKKVQTNKLISALLVETIVNQVVKIIIAIILIPAGLVILKQTFFHNGAAGYWALSCVIIGFFMDILVSAVFFIAGLSTKIHRLLISFFLKLGVKVRYIKDYDREYARLEHEASELRRSIKIIWTDKKTMILLCIVNAAPSFLAVYYFAQKSMGTLDSDISYFAFLSSQKVVNVANTFMPTPGGAGTIDALFYAINFSSFKNATEDNIKTFTGFYRFWTYIVPLVVSMSTLILISINEKIYDKLNYANIKDRIYNKKIIKRVNYFKFYALTACIILFIIFVFFMFKIYG